MFGESSDEDDDDDGCTGHCRGHKHKCYRHDAEGKEGRNMFCL